MIKLTKEQEKELIEKIEQRLPKESLEKTKKALEETLEHCKDLCIEDIQFTEDGEIYASINYENKESFDYFLNKVKDVYGAEVQKVFKN